MTGNGMQMRLVLPDDRTRLRELDGAIVQALSAGGVAFDVIADVLLIAEEVVCNAIDHGFSEHRAHEIVVTVAQLPEQVAIEFRDDGVPYNPLDRPSPDLEADIGERPIGGLGVHLVRALADEVTYNRDAAHNVLRVVLHRSQQEPLP
jgi:anti-sigma regulatory factor (Ser/Thr protein kinase)